jgi:hypothetical protein
MRKRAVKYFDKSTLVEANLLAMHANRNAWVEPQFLASILLNYPDSAIFPVQYALLHNQVELRCIVYMGDEEHGLMLDIPFELYEMLDEIEFTA